MAMNSLQALKAYMEKDGGRKITMDEIRALSPEERKELGELAAKELGETLNA